ncbi:MAG: hypothetical protein ACFCVA_06695 [Gammaproteobacteria bacterium]
MMRSGLKPMAGHGHRFVRVALEHTVSAQAFGSPTPWCKGVCGKDAGPKPTGTSSRCPLLQGGGCPQGKGHPAAETMTNARWRDRANAAVKGVASGRDTVYETT